MKRLLALLLVGVQGMSAYCQNVICGRVYGTDRNALTGANIMIKDSYDGCSSDLDGYFRLETKLSGKQTMVFKYIGYMDREIEVTIPTKDSVFICLKEENYTLDAVQITAGNFEAGDKVKSVSFEPLDIVLTASSSADIYGTLSTLPGAQFVGEQGKLFVRGGEAYESRTFINGLLVQNPYRQTMANVPSKGRFSPLLFSGTMFSSGGYSAEYGQALSSALVLSTNSMPSDNLANINLYSMGFGLSMQRVFRNNSAIVLSYDHSDLDPYYKVVKQNIDWTTPPKAHFLTFNYFKKTSNSGMLKSMFSLNMDKSGLYYPTSEMDYTFIKDEKQNELDTELKSFGLLNNNKYVFSISDKNTMNISLGLSYDKRNVGLEQFNNLDLCDNFFLSELKIKDIISITDRNKLSYGIDYQLNYFKESIKRNEVDTELDYTDHSIATYAELESYVMRRFTTRVGVRAEYSSVLNLFKVSPRLSLAYSLGDLGLFSFAYGTFFQNPESEYLKFTRKLKPERAEHFILDYQYERNKRVFRLEAYYKKYHNLIKYTSYDTNPDSYNNAGSGYAKGLEVFYRDKKTIPGGDFWISYSLMDTKRDYRDFPILAMPKYFSKHNFSFVYKHWIRAIHSNVGLTNNWMSGRHYYDPNKPVEQFMKDKTKPYNDLCINYTYDFSSYTKWPVTLFFSVTNLLGQNHVFGFSYAKNDHDTYDLYPIKPMAKRTYTFAILITLK